MSFNSFDFAVELKKVLNQVILGKEQAVELLCAAVLCGGHVLIEDLPGSGKTSLAKAMALCLGLPFRRVQFTPDLMPADLSGSMIWNPNHSNFDFHPGPLFSSLLLADEINRASPRTQSALLEAMEEHKVSIDGETRPLPSPFIVLATQNPIEHHGVYPLPEAQLDRFMIRMELGFPDAQAELALLSRNLDPTLALPTLSQASDLLEIRQHILSISVHPDLLQWLVQILQKSRQSQDHAGLSPRAGQAVLNMAKSLAWLEGLDHIRPHHLEKAWIPATAHRLFHEGSRSSALAYLQSLRQANPFPR